MLASAQMSGDATTVLAAAEKLRGLIPDEAARTIALVQPVKAAPYFAHAQFSPPAAVLALPDPGDAIPFLRAMWHYARGIALVKQRSFEAARGEADAIDTISRTADFSLLTAADIPSQDVLALASNLIHARILQARGDYTQAIERFEKAAALQDGLPYMEPPYWYYPVRQSLGAALIQARRYDEAEKQLELSLMRAPNNGWTYHAYTELYKARGDAAMLGKAERALRDVWIGDKDLLVLSNL